MRRLVALKRFTLVWVIALYLLCPLPMVHAAASPPGPSLIIKFVEGLTASEQAAIIASHGGVEVSVIKALGLHVISIPSGDPAAVLDSYQADPQVERAELNRTRKSEGAPSDTSYGVQWALSKVGWDSVFGAILPSRTARVAVLDTGIDASHPDLAGNVIPGTSILDSSDGLSDANGHGTSLAGIVAAVTDNELGIAGVGLGGVQVMPVTVLGADGVGQDSDIISGVIWAADHGADVILMGFSNPDFSDNLQEAIDYAWSKGAVLVAATGNDGSSAPSFPAGDRGVIGVSATDESDALAFDSNHGDDTFLAAPGTNIYTTALNGTYTYMTGTSASSAVVAGVAAFMKAANPALTNGVIVGRLAKSADAIGTAGDANNQSYFGNGRINMAAALANGSTDDIEPAGAAPVGSGGPYIGPYAAASQAGDLKVGLQNGTITYGVDGSATFLVTVTTNGQGTAAGFGVTGLPGGASFSPQSVSNCKPPGCSVTMTVSIPAGQPAGQTPFTVSAASNGSTITAGGTLTISKATAMVNLGGLARTYTGQPLSPTATTTPSNLALQWANAPQTNAGSYPVTATVNDNNYQGSATGTFVIEKAPATVTLTNTTQTYNGSALTPTATTNPANLNVTWTNAPKTDAGTYPVTATISDANYQGSVSDTFTINKAPAQITLSNLTQTYSGKALAPTVATTPPNLHVDLTNAPQTNAGTYAVTAVVNEPNYQGSASANFTINKAPATVTLSGLTQTFSGSALSPGVTTNPEGLKVDVTNAPQTNAGSYPVSAIINEANYEGSASGTFVINKASASITLDSMMQTYSGNALSPTASTVPANLKVDFTNVPQVNAGSYAVTATINDINYTGSTSGTFIINKAPAQIILSNMTQTYNGNALSPGVSTTPGGLKVDLTNAPQTNAGSYQVTATVNEANYQGSTSGTFIINKAAAKIDLGNLTQTYNGSALSPSVSTTPGGLKVDLTNAPQTNAGSYQVTATVNEPNYEGSTSGTFIINKATASVTLGNLTQTYNGNALSPVVSTSPSGLKVDLTNAPQTNAGSYQVTATVNEANYDGSATNTFTIAKAPATVSFGNLTQTYNGNALSPTVTTSPAGLKVDLTNAGQTNAGSYQVTATVNESNYEGSARDTFTINKAPATVTLDNLTQTYSGKALTPGATTVPANLHVEFANAPQTNAGSYPVTATIKETNYEGSAASTFVINKAPAQITLGNLTQTYNGNALTPTVTTTPTDLKVDLTNAPQIGAGSYPVTATINEANYEGSTGGTFVINKAHASIALSGLTQTYNGSALSPTVATSPPGLKVDLTNAPQTNAGSYPVTAAINEANYEGSTSDTFIINKATASITLGNLTQTYSGSPLTPAAATSPTGLQVDWSNAPQTGAGSYQVTATVNDRNYQGSSSGTFTVNKASAGISFANLTQTYSGSALTPTATTSPAGLAVQWNNAPQTNAGSYEVSATINDANYQGSAAGTFTIKKATARVTLGNLTQTYSGSALTPTAATVPSGLGVDWSNAPQKNAGSYQVTATVNDPNYEGSAADTFTINKAQAPVTLGALTQTYTGSPLAPTVTTVPDGLGIAWSNAPQKNAGSYQVTATVNDANYQGSASGTFTIGKALATVTLGALTQTYSGTTLTPTATTVPDGLAIVWSNAQQKNAGSYPVTATVNDANFQGSAADTFTIGKAPATVTLGALTQTYNGTTLAPTVTTVPDGLAIAWSNAPQKNAGSYAVTATVNDANYEGSAAGTFVINKAPATVTLGNLTQTYNGSALVPSLTTVPAGLKVDWVNAPQNNAGSYNVTATVNDPNYGGSAVGTFTINPAAATVTLGNLTQTYTGSALAPQVTTVPPNLQVAWTNGQETGAGTYNVTATVADPNYRGQSSGTFTISKAPATVALSALSQTYTGAALTPTAVTTPANLNIVWNSAPKTNAGSYPVTATVDDPNYAGSASGTFVINKATATVNLADLTQVYTGSALVPTATTVPANLAVVWTNAPKSAAGSYAVTATVADANYQGSAAGTFSIIVACGTPSSITVPASNSTGVLYVSWGTSSTSGATYALQYRKDNGDWISLYSGTATSKTVTVSASGSYQFQVWATKTGYPDSPVKVSGNCQVTLTCGAPGWISVPASNSTGTISVSWGSSNVANVTYHVDYSKDGGSTWTRDLYSGTATSTSVILTASGTYSFRVYATKDNYAQSGFTASTSCVVGLRCGAPDTVTIPAGNSTGTIFVYWSASNVADVTYHLDYSTDGGSTWTYDVYSGPATSATVSLPGNGTYTFRVYATKDGYTQSGFTSSTPCVAVLKCGAPAWVTVATTTSTGAIFVYWGASNVADVTYHLEYSTDGGATWTPSTYVGSNTSASVYVTANGTYRFRVYATKSAYEASDATVSSNTSSVAML